MTILSPKLTSIFLVGMLAASLVIAGPVIPTQQEFQFKIELKLVTPQEAFDFCKADGAWPGLTTRPSNQALGCTTFYREEKRCVIVTPIPEENGDDAMMNLGHEVLHCAFGNYHK